MRDRRMDRPMRHTFLPWSLLLLATLYDHMIMYVGLRSCLSCFNVFFHVSVFYSLLCVVVFYLWHFIDLFSCIAASLFNKLTYLLTLMTAHDDDTSSTLACHPSGAGRRTGICQRRGHTGRDETTELGNVLVYTSMLGRLSMARCHHHHQLTDFMGGRSRHNAPAERRRRRGPTRLRSLDVSYSSCRRPVLWALCFSGSLSSDYSVISIVWCVISINKLIDWLIDWSILWCPKRFLPAQRYASAGTSYGLVSVSVTSRCSIETVERIWLVLAWELPSTYPTICYKMNIILAFDNQSQARRNVLVSGGTHLYEPYTIL